MAATTADYHARSCSMAWDYDHWPIQAKITLRSRTVSLFYRKSQSEPDFVKFMGGFAHKKWILVRRNKNPKVNAAASLELSSTSQPYYRASLTVPSLEI